MCSRVHKKTNINFTKSSLVMCDLERQTNEMTQTGSDSNAYRKTFNLQKWKIRAVEESIVSDFKKREITISIMYIMEKILSILWKYFKENKLFTLLFRKVHKRGQASREKKSLPINLGTEKNTENIKNWSNHVSNSHKMSDKKSLVHLFF